VGGRRALLDTAHGERGDGEVDLLPAQVNKLGSPQAVPVGHQDHRGVAVRQAVAFGGVNERLDLGRLQVLPGPRLGVGPTQRAYCPI
jgi:hypothetical protein